MEENKNQKHISENDNRLPVANICRIIKNNLPKDVKLSKGSRETFQDCLCEFISFITSEANDKCLSEKRKIIKGEDIIYALKNLGFDKYTPILDIYLAKYKLAQNVEIKEDKEERSEEDKKEEDKKE